jgi:hypothetical protein
MSVTPSPHPLLAVLATAGLAVGLAACGQSEVVPAQATTTTVAVDEAAPTGSPEELLAFVRDRSLELGLRIAEGGSREALEQIEQAWAAAGPGIEDVNGTAYRTVDSMVGLLRVAVERRRPADADKAARNIDAVYERLVGGPAAGVP